MRCLIRQCWHLLVACAIAAPAALADSHGLIDRIDYEQDGENRFALVILTERLMYLSHYPPGNAATIEIRLKSVDNAAGGLPPETFQRTRSVMLAPLAQKFPLISVSYEKESNDNVVFVLRFSENTPLRISQSRDLRSLEIALTDSLPSKQEKRRTTVATTSADENLVARADRLKQLMTLGQRSLESQQYETARAVFADIIYLGPHPYMSEAEKLHRLAQQGTSTKASNSGEHFFTIDELESLVSRADAVINKGDNRQAIVLFTKIGRLPEHPYSPHALEMLGVARQRNGQSAHAKANYRDYLARYPSGDGAVRVQQRLAELLATGRTPEPRPMEKLKQDGVASTDTGSFRADHFGMLSQSYYHGDISFDGLEEDRSDQSLLLTHLQATSRWRNSRFDLRSNISLDHEEDFLEQQTSDGRIDISTLYLESRDSRFDYAVRIGRQPANAAGVLGRYDGAWLQYRVSASQAADVAVGFPVVLSDTDTLDTDKRFVTASYEMTNLFQSLDLVPYFHVQQDTGVTERRAVGLEARYFLPRGNYFGLLDYDTSFSDVNILMLNGNLVLSTARSVHFSFDRRKSPLLFLSNGLIDNVAVNSLELAKAIFSEEELRALAKDQSGTTTLLNLGWTEQLRGTVQASVDISRSTHDYSANLRAADPALGESESATGLSGQLRFQDLVMPGDLTVLGVFYANSDRYNNKGVSAQNRLRIPGSWSIESRLRADSREDTNGSRLTRLRPSARAIFDRKRSYTIEAEIGWELTDYGGASSNADTQRFFYNVGYRWTFR